MMNGAKWSDEMKQAYWMEAASTATKLENIMNEKGSKTPYYAFYNENPDYEANLRTFGELGIVTETPGQSIKSKLHDRGIKCTSETWKNVNFLGAVIFTQIVTIFIVIFVKKT